MKDLNELKKRVAANLTDEQKEQLKACKSKEDALAVLAKAGCELPDEMLEAVSGGLTDEEWESINYVLQSCNPDNWN